jgi:predicted adenylyl cyclase CyaB
MRLEVETKARVANLEGILDRLKCLTNLANEDTVLDIYFVPAETRDASSKRRIRLRKKGKGGIVTYKRDVNITPSQTDREIDYTVCEELEFHVSDAIAFSQLMEKCGMNEVWKRKKRRRIFRIGSAQVELNTIEDIGNFVEIEVVCDLKEIDQAQREIHQVTKMLGLAPSDFDLRWYTSM